jgi:hypothetical protein
MARRPGAVATILPVALALLGARGDTVAAQTRAQAPRPTLSAQTEAHQKVSNRTRKQIDQLRARSEGSRVPPADSFTVGPRGVPAAATTHGPVAVADGTLDVYGRIEGNAFAMNGDIVVHNGGIIAGDAMSIGGHVLLDGGRIDGEELTLSAPPSEVVRNAQASAPLSTWQSVKLVLGWFSVLVIIGLGVLIFAEPNMDGVVETIEANFAKAFWFGVLGQIVALPALVLLCIGLALTILGVLLIPFAAVAYAIAFVGLLALGFLAVARLTGRVWSRDGDAAAKNAARGANLRALFIGLVVYLGLWLLAAIFTWQPVAGAVLRGVALAVSWVAVTVGLGAALLSRAGTKRMDARARAAAAARRPAPEDLAWQTPTPVTGVAAARRPVVTAKEAS